MTSIMNYDEKKNTMGRPSDEILNSLNRLHFAKNAGVLGSGELSNLIIKVGSLFANQIKQGIRTQEQVEDYEKEIPNGKYKCFSREHDKLDVAFLTTKQTNSAVLFEQEQRLAVSHPVKIK